MNAERLFCFLRHCHVPILSNSLRHCTSTKANCEASHCGTFLHSHLINSVQSRSSRPLVRNFVSYVKKDYYVNKHSCVSSYHLFPSTHLILISSFFHLASSFLLLLVPCFVHFDNEINHFLVTQGFPVLISLFGRVRISRENRQSASSFTSVPEI